MNQTILNRAQRLYSEAREIVAEEVKLKQKSVLVVRSVAKSGSG
jgi:hypothetical protein